MQQILWVWMEKGKKMDVHDVEMTKMVPFAGWYIGNQEIGIGLVSLPASTTDLKPAAIIASISRRIE
jgi:hypothetical protein